GARLGLLLPPGAAPERRRGAPRSHPPPRARARTAGGRRGAAAGAGRDARLSRTLAGDRADRAQDSGFTWVSGLAPTVSTSLDFEVATQPATAATAIAAQLASARACER